MHNADKYLYYILYTIITYIRIIYILYNKYIYSNFYSIIMVTVECSKKREKSKIKMLKNS